MKQYFINKPYIYDDYKAAVKLVMNEGEEDVGLYMGIDSWEYPLWVLADRHASKGTPQFRHLVFTDISNTIDIPNVPTLVLATKVVKGNIIAGKEYVVIFESKHIQVLKMLMAKDGLEPSNLAL